MGCQLNKPFNVYEAADTWYQTVSAIDVEAYYRERVLKLNKVTFVSKIASGIYDLKIFDVIKPAKAARFASKKYLIAPLRPIYRVMRQTTPPRNPQLYRRIGSLDFISHSKRRANVKKTSYSSCDFSISLGRVPCYGIAAISNHGV